MTERNELIARLREDRLMNPDYATRLEAAAALEADKQLLERMRADMRLILEKESGAGYDPIQALSEIEQIASAALNEARVIQK